LSQFMHPNRLYLTTEFGELMPARQPGELVKTLNNLIRKI